jgi:hypothetical protein
MLKKSIIYALSGITIAIGISIDEVLAQTAVSQTEYLTKKFYTSAEYEIIFSFANISSPDGVNVDQNMRWSPVFNPAGHLNYDISQNFGVNAGLALRNVGFIPKFDPDPNDPQLIDRLIVRTYNLGLPMGVKLGMLHQDDPFFLFLGYELEVPIHFRQRDFSGSDRQRNSTSWFSDRTPTVMNSVFAGIQLPNGTALKFKYYLTEFFNPDFTTTQGSELVRPYEDFNANVFYFSLEFFPFKSVDQY